MRLEEYRAQDLLELFGKNKIATMPELKETVGNFKNPGGAWCREPIAVKDHDFRSEAEGMAIPYGVYDIHANRGTFFIGMSYDTPQFAVESIEKWWRTEGKKRYLGFCQLAIANSEMSRLSLGISLALDRLLAQNRDVIRLLIRYRSMLLASVRALFRGPAMLA